MIRLGDVKWEGAQRPRVTRRLTSTGTCSISPKFTPANPGVSSFHLLKIYQLLL